MGKILSGTVVSNKMKNTAVVVVGRVVTHPLYGKKLKKTTRFNVDTKNISVDIGDVVKIEETKKLSKTKYFKVIKKEDKRKG